MKDEQAEFWLTVAETYDRVVDLQIGGRTRSLVRDQVARETDLGRLVEFGCGTAFFTATLARSAATVLATDLSEGMLAIARQRVRAPNVTFQTEDCQHTSLADGSIDTAVISLVLHFTAPDQTLAEMHRILRPGGSLLIVNLDLNALHGLARIRSLIRVLYRGITGYRTKPPKGFGRNVLTEAQLGDALGRSGFRVVKTEVVVDPSRPSNIPVEYVRATKP